MLWELIPLERNPMGLVELKGVSKRLRPPRILTEEEFGALLKSAGSSVSLYGPSRWMHRTSYQRSHGSAVERNQLRKLGHRNLCGILDRFLLDQKQEQEAERARMRHSHSRRICRQEEQSSVSGSEQTAKSQLSKVEGSSVLTLHSAAQQINRHDTEAGEAALGER
jgi:hypothetical protein